MSQEIREAWVIYKSSRNVRVRSDGREWLCSLRGKLREIDRRSGRSPVVVGDNVRIRPLGDDEAVLEEVLPRTNEVRRSKSTPGKEGLPSWKAVRTQARRERVVAANMDQILLVLAAKTPAPRWGLVDRVLVSATYDELDVGICLNKWDQVAGDEEAHEALEEALAVYEGIGYPIFRTTMIDQAQRESIEDTAVAAWLHERKTVLSGHSGVGKSTLLGALCPTEEIETGNISEATGKGRHVTTAATLYDLPRGGVLVDTPGYRQFGILDVPKAQLALYFRELEPHVSRCRFKDCVHIQEPGCGVLAALENGEISDLRYSGYLQILGSLDED